MNDFKLFVFDMDGVVVDSEPLHFKAKETILQDYGLEGLIDLKDTVGLPNETLWDGIIKKYGLLTEPDHLVKLQNDLILEFMHKKNMKPVDGLIKLFDKLESKGIKIGLASSSNRYFVDRVLKYLGIDNRFMYTVTGDEINSKKPSPDCYEKVLKLSGISPEKAAAAEDSSAGVKAAVTAGLTCFGFQNPGSGQQDLSKADCIVTKLEDIIPYL